MDEETFRYIVAEEYAQVPEKFARKLKNVALLVEDEPSLEVRRQEGLSAHESLLGLYQGIPQTARGIDYGVGPTLPDTITLYRLPILDEAAREGVLVRDVVRETIWHEIGHYFGMDEGMVGRREEEGTNTF